MTQTSFSRSKQLNQIHESALDERLKILQVESLIVGLKELITECLSNKSHARYLKALDILRCSRNPNHHTQKNLFTELITLRILLKIGVKPETILEIIKILYNPKLNYHNIEGKIKSFKGIKIQGNKWIVEQDRERNMKEGIGGDCVDLARYFVKLFNESKLAERIKNESNLECTLYVARGSSKDHFYGDDILHIFTVLVIGDMCFIIDPTLGKIIELQASQYQIKGMTPNPSYEDTGIRNIGKISTLPNGQLNISAGEKSIWSLGFLNGTQIYAELVFAKFNEKYIPLIHTTNTTGETNSHFIDNDGKHSYTKGSFINEAQAIEIENYLKLIMKKVHN